MLVDDDFPHHGEHLSNDDKMAEMTVSLIAVFVIMIALGMFSLILTQS